MSIIAVTPLLLAPTFGQFILKMEKEDGYAIVFGTEYRCLAYALYHEARSEPEVGQLAVLNVIHNRKLDPRFPDTYCRVVTEVKGRNTKICQFSGLCNLKQGRPTEQKAWTKSLSLTEEFLKGDWPRDVTEGALWYHAVWMKRPPKWARGRKSVQIGNHRFYKNLTIVASR